MGQLKQLAGHTVIYGASSVLGRALNFLLVPFYTAVFATDDYGIVTELYAYVAFLNIIYTYGFETAFFRFATKSDNPQQYYDITQSALLITSVLFSGVLILFADEISVLLNYPGQGRFIVWLALVLAIDAIVAVPFARLRLEGKAVKFASLKFFNICLNIGLNVFFILGCPYWLKEHPESWIGDIYNENIGVGYVFLSNLIANAVYIPFFLSWIVRVKLRANGELKTLLNYSLPIMLIGLAGVTSEMFSRVLLKYRLPEGYYPEFTNEQILGIFGACYKLSVFMTLAVQAFKYAFEPFFFSKSKDQDSKEMFAKVMHGFVIFGTFSWLFISLFLDDLAPLFLRRESYLTGSSIVPWLLGGSLFLGIYFNLSVWYKLTDKTIYGAYISIFGAVITVVLNLALIPVLGYDGSAITTFVTYLIMMVASYWLGQQHYYIPYQTSKGLFYMLLAGLSIVCVYFCGFSGIYKYSFSIGLMIIFSAFVWILDVKKGTFSRTR